MSIKVNLAKHSAVHYKNKIFIFGGIDENGNVKNKVDIFNLATEEYSQAVVYGTKPKPVTVHTATIVEE